MSHIERLLKDVLHTPHPFRGIYLFPYPSIYESVSSAVVRNRLFHGSELTTYLFPSTCTTHKHYSSIAVTEESNPHLMSSQSFFVLVVSDLCHRPGVPYILKTLSFKSVTVPVNMKRYLHLFSNDVSAGLYHYSNMIVVWHS